MIYLSGHVCKQRHPRLGFLLSLDVAYRVPDDCLVAVDNSCFSNPAQYSDAKYEAYLRRMPKHRTLFAPAPDVLGSHEATVGRSIPMLRQIRKIGLPAAFVAQDGWSEHDTPWDELDVLFVGGSTHFKFRGGRDAVIAARQRGKLTHMGRVNSLDRLRAAVGIGCNSTDGTFLKFGPDANWPRLKYWLDHITNQPEMSIENHI